MMADDGIYRVSYTWGNGVMDSELRRPDGSIRSTKHEWRAFEKLDGTYEMRLVPITFDTGQHDGPL
jgi:hypothetical protein